MLRVCQCQEMVGWWRLCFACVCVVLHVSRFHVVGSCQLSKKKKKKTAKRLSSHPPVQHAEKLRGGGSSSEGRVFAVDYPDGREEGGGVCVKGGQMQERERERGRGWWQFHPHTLTKEGCWNKEGQRTEPAQPNTNHQTHAHTHT